MNIGSSLIPSHAIGPFRPVLSTLTGSPGPEAVTAPVMRSFSWRCQGLNPSLLHDKHVLYHWVHHWGRSRTHMDIARGWAAPASSFSQVRVPKTPKFTSRFYCWLDALPDCTVIPISFQVMPAGLVGYILWWNIFREAFQEVASETLQLAGDESATILKKPCWWQIPFHFKRIHASSTFWRPGCSGQ